MKFAIAGISALHRLFSMSRSKLCAVKAVIALIKYFMMSPEFLISPWEPTLFFIKALNNQAHHCSNLRQLQSLSKRSKMCKLMTANARLFLLLLDA